MIGNANLQLSPTIIDKNNPNSNNPMVYVDVDGNPDTWNSSSANLTFSGENGALPDCSNIIYAGLYWTGRAHDGTSPNTFTVTQTISGNTITKIYNKNVVSFKGPKATAYTTFTASTNDI